MLMFTRSRAHVSYVHLHLHLHLHLQSDSSLTHLNQVLDDYGIWVNYDKATNAGTSKIVRGQM